MILMLMKLQQKCVYSHRIISFHSFSVASARARCIQPSFTIIAHTCNICIAVSVFQAIYCRHFIIHTYIVYALYAFNYYAFRSLDLANAKLLNKNNKTLCFWIIKSPSYTPKVILSHFIVYTNSSFTLFLRMRRASYEISIAFSEHVSIVLH